MIIKFVLNNTSDEKLATILQNTKIANVDYEEIVGTAYPKYMDNSYYIEIGERIERRVRLLSDVFAVLFMFVENNNNPAKFYNMVLMELKDDRSEKIRYDYSDYPIYI